MSQRKKKLISNIDQEVYDALVERGYEQRISRSQIVNRILSAALGIDTSNQKKKKPVPA